MQFETRRKLGDPFRQLLQLLQRHRRHEGFGETACRVFAPVHGVLIPDHAQRRIVGVVARIQCIAIVIDQLVRITLGNVTAGHQPGYVLAAHARVLANSLIHHGLRGGWLVRLVVSQAPVTDQVDHHILAECLPVLQRQASRGHGRFRVIAVHVKNRRLDHFRHI